LRLDHSVPDGVSVNPIIKQKSADLVGKPERFPYLGERPLWDDTVEKQHGYWL
jgi:hypothetical protein